MNLKYCGYSDFNGWLGGVLRVCSARSGHGCQASYSVGQSVGTNRSEVAPRRGATSAPENTAKTGPVKICKKQTIEFINLSELSPLPWRDTR